MTTATSKVWHRRREEVLEVLRSAVGPLGIAEIAERLGVHPNTVRFHLNALTRAGRVERLPSSTDDRDVPRRRTDPSGGWIRKADGSTRRWP